MGKFGRLAVAGVEAKMQNKGVRWFSKKEAVRTCCKKKISAVEQTSAVVFQVFTTIFHQNMDETLESVWNTVFQIWEVANYLAFQVWPL